MLTLYCGKTGIPSTQQQWLLIKKGFAAVDPSQTNAIQSTDRSNPCPTPATHGQLLQSEHCCCLHTVIIYITARYCPTTGLVWTYMSVSFINDSLLMQCMQFMNTAHTELLNILNWNQFNTDTVFFQHFGSNRTSWSAVHGRQICNRNEHAPAYANAYSICTNVSHHFLFQDEYCTAFKTNHTRESLRNVKCTSMTATAKCQPTHLLDEPFKCNEETTPHVWMSCDVV